MLAIGLNGYGEMTFRGQATRTPRSRYRVRVDASAAIDARAASAAEWIGGTLRTATKPRPPSSVSWLQAYAIGRRDYPGELVTEGPEHGRRLVLRSRGEVLTLDDMTGGGYPARPRHRGRTRAVPVVLHLKLGHYPTRSSR